MFSFLAAAALAAAGPTTADSLVATAETACIPSLTRELRWPTTLAEQDKLLARFGLSRGVPKEFYDKLRKFDPRVISLSRALLAKRVNDDGAFAFVLGGVDFNCRLLVYRTADAAALAKAVAARLVARGWKQLPPPPSKTPKQVFVRRLASGWIVMAQLVMRETSIAPMLLIDAFPPGSKVPAEFGI